jgi:hypothetical protein
VIGGGVLEGFADLVVIGLVAAWGIIGRMRGAL